MVSQEFLEKYGLSKEEEGLVDAIEALIDRKFADRKEDMHDTTYKGDDVHLEIRALVLALVRRNVCITFGDLSQAPGLRMEPMNLRYHKQWNRQKSQNLIPGRPAGPDGEQIIDFKLMGRRWAYTTTTSRLHCAIERAAQAIRKGKPRDDLIHRTRNFYQASRKNCKVCNPTGVGPQGYYSL